MLELYIIRHGFAGIRLEDEALDEERPLKKKGKEKMKDISKGLKEMDVTFDVVLTSPLVRAKESAEILNAYCCKNNEVTVTDLLKPDASYEALVKFLNQQKEFDKIAIVGHEPFLSGFACFCLSNTKNSFINLKKSGVLKLDVDKVIKPKRCALAWLIEPRHIING
ncbi:MAG: phosphohistidine phosphatase SixA [Parachlamydiaceae bacterium]|nr:phosphohistidine phosphatase SixA [Parachlamydiaceae bacterium]